MTPTPQANASTEAKNKALAYLLVAVTAALIYVLLPFYTAILWGIIIALLFAPLYRWLLPRVRQRPNVAAGISLLLAFVMVVLPTLLVATSLAVESSRIYEQLQSGELKPTQYLRDVFNTLPNGVTTVLDRFGLVSFNTLQRRLTAALTQGTQYFATQTFAVGQNTFEFVASVFITFYLAFFLIRDGNAIVRVVQRALPIAPAQKQALLTLFTTVIRATVKGNLLVAAIQGALGGLAFWALGISGALLWAVLMMFLSLLPALGAALVWGPLALYLLLTGAVWKGVLLCVFGVLVIGLVDNLLRPILVGKDTRMPDYVVMVSTLGGMAVFGVNGFVLGPVIAAMFIAVWQIYVSTVTDAL
ncbi:MAG: AI-2E family transporter [Rhodoferax sp.]|nr:AI-2E family transporter [Rhodoferax sp.]